MRSKKKVKHRLEVKIRPGVGYREGYFLKIQRHIHSPATRKMFGKPYAFLAIFKAPLGKKTFAIWLTNTLLQHMLLVPRGVLVRISSQVKNLDDRHIRHWTVEFNEERKLKGSVK